MKTIKRFLLVAAIAVTASGCTSAFYSSTGAYDDLYATHDVQAIAERQKAEAEVRKAEAEALKAEAEAREAQMKAEAAEYQAKLAAINAALQAENSSVKATIIDDGLLITDDNIATLDNSYVADSYENAYARRLKGFSSPTYRMPSSYFNLRYNSSHSIVTAYDPALYNIMVSGDEVWVEPKYITSMFGTWGAINATIAFTSPWYFGWRSWGTYDPWYYRSFRSCWGFPRYSWWDWNWHMCYPHPDIYRWTGSLGWWGWGAMYCPMHYHWGWHYPQFHGHWTGHWGHVNHHYGWGGGWSPSFRPHAPRLGNGPNPTYDRGGSIYGSRNQSTGQRSRNNNGAIVNRGSSHSTPYRSPSSGTTYGNGTRGKSATAAIQQQRAAEASRASSVGRGTSRSTGRSSYSSSSSSSSSRSSSVSINRSSSSSSSSSYSSGSSYSSSSSSSGGGGGSRGGGGSSGGGGGSGSRGR